MIPLLVILGPTASGKSALAIALAQQLNGEVISADAMAVYRGMDVGTAKPTAMEQAGVPHHLIDCCEPDQRCDAQRWFDLADAAMRAIHARGRLPIIAGGTPLYVKLLLEGISAGAPRDEAARARLQQRYRDEGPAALFAELERVDPLYAADRHPNDERRIVRALEVYQLTGQPFSSFHTTDGIRRTDLAPLLIGLHWDKPVLHARIATRTRRMLDAGLFAEVAALRDRLCPEARQAVGYKEVIAHFDGAYDLAETEERIARGTRHLAKHQLTWYRSWPDIQWLPGAAPDLAEQALTLAKGLIPVT